MFNFCVWKFGRTLHCCVFFTSISEYPMPPNATLIRVMYNSRQRQQVEAEWQVESGDNGGWTGFFLEYRKVSERPGKRGGSNSSQQQVQESAASQDWYRIIIQDPETRSHTVYGLIPTVTYQFRITAVNYHTFGHPSAVKIPGTKRALECINVLNFLTPKIRIFKNQLMSNVCYKIVFHNFTETTSCENHISELSGLNNSSKIN